MIFEFFRIGSVERRQQKFSKWEEGRRVSTYNNDPPALSPEKLREGGLEDCIPHDRSHSTLPILDTIQVCGPSLELIPRHPTYHYVGEEVLVPPTNILRRQKEGYGRRQGGS